MIIQQILIVFQMLITFSEKLNWERNTSPFGGEDIVIVNLSKGRAKQDGLENHDFVQYFIRYGSNKVNSELETIQQWQGKGSPSHVALVIFLR